MSVTSIDPERIVTLTFHGVGTPRRELDRGEDQVWVSRDRFLRILDAVREERQIEITFDDGNSSDLEFAVPALRERGLKATFFVLAGRIGEAGALGREDFSEMLRHGMDIGSHGMHHRPWRRLDDSIAAEEIFGAKELLEAAIGGPVDKAACPFGAYDRRTINYVRAAGFKTLFTSDGGSARQGQWLRVRNTVRAHDEPQIVRSLLAARDFAPGHLAMRAKVLIKRLR